MTEEGKKKRKKWSATAAFGGGVVAATSGAFFGIPLAAMVFLGAAGAGVGYRMQSRRLALLNGQTGSETGEGTRKRSKEELEEIPTISSPRRRQSTQLRFLRTSSAPPSQKRIKFLIKWASIKLDDLEETDYPSIIQLLDDIVSEFSLVVEAAKVATVDSERQKLLFFVRFIEKLKVYKKYAQANQVWLRS